MNYPCFVNEHKMLMIFAFLELKHYKDRVQPWWIGQQIVAVTESNEEIIATIRDYDPRTGLVQIWYDNAQSTHNIVRLDSFVWSVPDTLPICHNQQRDCVLYPTNDFVPSTVDWQPMQLEHLQKVKVQFRRKNWYTAFVDGYDDISRRHRVNYGDTSEWLWATSSRVQRIDNSVSLSDLAELAREICQLNDSSARPPPWDPEPYGLDHTFAEHSSSAKVFLFMF